jgi:hypothetical protein
VGAKEDVMAYKLEGELLEVCTCKVLCPCWIGEDPDGDGTCDSVNSWHINQGQIDGVDVSNLTIAGVNHIPGNVLKGNWQVVFFVDDKASDAQHTALVEVFTGKRGGPVKDLAGLYGKILAVERTPIVFEVIEGKGRLKIGQQVEAEMEPYKGATGEVTTLHGTAFSTIPGAPAYVSKASRYRVKEHHLGFNIDLSGHNAIQGKFRFEG